MKFLTRITQLWVFRRRCTAATSDKKPAVQTAAEPTPAVQTQLEPRPPAGSGSETHENNKIALTVGAVAAGFLLFLALR